MQFTCTRENLGKALDLVSPLAGKQGSLPILDNIFIEATEAHVQLSSTNLETGIKATVRARTETPGSFTVPAKTLADYVKLLSDEQVIITLEGNELLVACGSSKTKIKGVSSEDFPVLPSVEEGNSYALDVQEFKKSLSRTVIAVAKNEIRPELSGIFMSLFSERHKGLVLAATDSYRLAEVQMDVSQGEENSVCIIPSRVAYEIIRLLGSTKTLDNETNVRMWISENQIALRYDGFELTGRLVEGTYPDYTQIIPDAFKTNASFPVNIMVNKIKAASLFTTVGVNAVSFDLNASEGNVSVSSTSTQTGEHSSEIDADISGEENSILLNHRYVLDGLNNMESDDVTLGVNSGDTPCMFQPKDKKGYLYIVMPIRQ